MKYNRRSFIKLGGITAVSFPLGFTACQTAKKNTQSKKEISQNKELENIAGLYNLNHIPYSSPGSYLKISGRCASGQGRIMISTVRKIPYIDFATQDSPFDYYEIALFKGGKEIPYAAGSNSSYVSLEGKGVTARISIWKQETFVFDVKGGDLVLLPVHSCAAIQKISPSFYLLNDYRGMCFHQIRAGEDTKLEATASSTVSGTTGPYHDTPYTLTFSGKTVGSGAIRFNRQGLKWTTPLPILDEVISINEKEWNTKKAAMPLVAGKYKKAAESAWWINHSCTVAREGEISRRTILMSKNWMNQVWAWDNCFNTLAMAKADKELAFDQMRIFFDKQTADGMFPDSISSMATRYGHVKPPIYGWTMLQLMQILPEKELLPFIPEAYDAISRQTLWWYENRDPDGNEMCEYLHGNDSGWDNGSLFDQGYPTEGADLAAHLVLQCEALSKMAALSGKDAEAEIWNKKSTTQLERLLTRSVHNFRFFSPLRGKLSAKDTKCLLNYIPLELGHRIPSEIWDTMVGDLKKEGVFLTANGLATQAVSTPEYRADGYWRGPIWAPSTYLIFTGLVDRNETTLAKTIAERFCDMCAKDEAMWENYDALTGKGLQCPAYTWTSSVFLLLAEWLNKN